MFLIYHRVCRKTTVSTSEGIDYGQCMQIEVKSSKNKLSVKPTLLPLLHRYRTHIVAYGSQIFRAKILLKGA